MVVGKPAGDESAPGFEFHLGGGELAFGVAQVEPEAVIEGAAEWRGVAEASSRSRCPIFSRTSMRSGVLSTLNKGSIS